MNKLVDEKFLQLVAENRLTVQEYNDLKAQIEDPALDEVIAKTEDACRRYDMILEHFKSINDGAHSFPEEGEPDEYLRDEIIWMEKHQRRCMVHQSQLSKSQLEEITTPLKKRFKRLCSICQAI